MKKKELNYFDELIKNVEFALEISRILKEYIENFEYNKLKNIKEKVHKFETEADRSLHNILNYLIKDFLPPIDREDIIRLVHKIDDVVDNLDEVVINLEILDVNKPREDFKKFTALIYECCMDLKEMMIKFNKFKKYDEIKIIVVNVNKLEETGDELYQNAIRNLYKNEKDSIEITKLSIIYNCLEECFDACEDVATCVEEIVLKNT